MLRVFTNWFHRPAIRMGRVNNSRIQTTRLRNAQFVSFISETHSFGHRSTDRYEQHLRRRKQLKALLWIALVSGGAWIAIESAHALTLF